MSPERWQRRMAALEAPPSLVTYESHAGAYAEAHRHDHTAVPEGDAALVVDIDLSILGQPPDKYAEFERNVRKEHRWVPQPLYRKKRCRILESFLERPSIYATEHFALRFEARARRNLASAIEKLRH